MPTKFDKISKITYAEVEVEDEECLVHPNAILEGGKWNIEVRIVVSVIINGKAYHFNDVMPIELEEGL